MRGEHYLPDNALTIDWIASRSEGRMSTPDLRVLFNNYIDNTEVIADEAVFFDANGNTLDASASGDVLDEIEGLIDDGILDGNWAEDIAGTVETLQQEGIAIGDMEVPTETQRFYSIRPDRYPAPNRFWRALDETKTDVKVNFSKPVFAVVDLPADQAVPARTAVVPATRCPSYPLAPVLGDKQGEQRLTVCEAEPAHGAVSKGSHRCPTISADVHAPSNARHRLLPNLFALAVKAA